MVVAVWYICLFDAGSEAPKRREPTKTLQLLPSVAINLILGRCLTAFDFLRPRDRISRVRGQ